MRRRTKKKKSPAGLVAGVLLLGLGAVLLWRGYTGDGAEDTPRSQRPLGIMGEMMTAPIDTIADTGLLVLVNGKTAVTDEPALSSLACAYRVVPVRIAEMYLREEALTALDAFFEAAEKAGFTNLVFSSGFRNKEEQARIYNDSADKSFVQPSGYSEHQTGLAADIFALGVTEAAMPNSREGQWLAENAVRFGFILRYPAGKEDITGIAYEPWHFRYIGAPHADYCEVNGLTYEEYITALRNSGGYEMEIGGTRYAVVYQTAAGGQISVPEDGQWSMSRDNTGGYIVTMWE